MKRKIVKIDEGKCNGCGQCIPNCPEGALQVIDKKARIVSDLFCDGLGACIGHCPEGAIKIIEREAEPYQEKKVMEKIVKQGPNVIKAHLEHLKEHGESGLLEEALDFLKEKGIKNTLEYEEKKPALPCGCPGSKVMDFKPGKGSEKAGSEAMQDSELRQWPVQLTLVPVNAPYFREADLLVSADCVPFANPNFHKDLLKGRRLVIACPKLDDIGAYREKLTEMLKANDIKNVTVAIMEVPCCYGLYQAVEEAVQGSGKDINLVKKIITIGGD